MRQCHRGDLEVHGPDTDSLTPQTDENVGCSLRPGQDIPRGKELNSSLQSLVGVDLLMWITDAVNLRQPPAELFLCGDDRRGDLFLSSLQTLA